MRSSACHKAVPNLLRPFGREIKCFPLWEKESLPLSSTPILKSYGKRFLRSQLCKVTPKIIIFNYKRTIGPPSLGPFGARRRCFALLALGCHFQNRIKRLQPKRAFGGHFSPVLTNFGVRLWFGLDTHHPLALFGFLFFWILGALTRIVFFLQPPPLSFSLVPLLWTRS